MTEMSVSGPNKIGRGRRRSRQSGQAIVEYALSAIVMATLAFGVVDFARAIYQQQVITTLAAQGANLAMRGGPSALSTTASTVISDSQNLKLGNYGRVIVTAA